MHSGYENSLFHLSARKKIDADQSDCSELERSGDTQGCLQEKEQRTWGLRMRGEGLGVTEDDTDIETKLLDIGNSVCDGLERGWIWDCDGFVAKSRFYYQ